VREKIAVGQYLRSAESARFELDGVCTSCRKYAGCLEIRAAIGQLQLQQQKLSHGRNSMICSADDMCEEDRRSFAERSVMTVHSLPCSHCREGKVRISFVVKCLEENELYYDADNTNIASSNQRFRAIGPFDFVSVADVHQLKSALKRVFQEISKERSFEPNENSLAALIRHSPELVWSCTYQFGILNPSALDALVTAM